MLAQTLNNAYLKAISLHNLGYVASLQGNIAQAAEHTQEVLAIMYRLGDKKSITSVLHTLGHIAQLQSNLVQATTYYREGLLLSQEINSAVQIGWHLSGLAEAAFAEDKPYRAARLIGCAETHFNTEVDMSAVERTAYEHTKAQIRTRLGSEVFTATLAEGRTMSPMHILATPEPTLSTPAPSLP